MVDQFSCRVHAGLLGEPPPAKGAQRDGGAPPLVPHGATAVIPCSRAQGVTRGRGGTREGGSKDGIMAVGRFVVFVGVFGFAFRAPGKIPTALCAS